jgi:hypothetical protein
LNGPRTLNQPVITFPSKVRGLQRFIARIPLSRARHAPPFQRRSASFRGSHGSHTIHDPWAKRTQHRPAAPIPAIATNPRDPPFPGGSDLWDFLTCGSGLVRPRNSVDFQDNRFQPLSSLNQQRCCASRSPQFIQTASFTLAHSFSKADRRGWMTIRQQPTAFLLPACWASPTFYSEFLTHTLRQFSMHSQGKITRRFFSQSSPAPF